MHVDRRGGTSSAAAVPQDWVRTALGVAVRHPRPALAAKVALAAAVAWMVVQPFEGVAAQYPYYAPFGAVVAVSTTVVSSARESAQSILAILVGAGVALAVESWLGHSVVTVAVVVGLGTLLAGWRRLGSMASWVPVSALFVLILGSADPEQYVAAYAGLTALGAAIGVGINLVLPPLPAGSTEALDRLRDTLVEQLEELAEALLSERPLSLAEWEERARTMEQAREQTRATVQIAAEGQRANWRARRWRHYLQRQYAAAVTLEQLPFIVEDVTAILAHETGAQETIPWGAPLRPRIAHVLQSAADLLRSVDGDGAGPREVAGLRDAIDHLVEEERRTREQTGDDLFGVGSIITALRRALDVVPVRED